MFKYPPQNHISRCCCLLNSPKRSKDTSQRSAELKLATLAYCLAICFAEDVHLQVMYQIVRDGALPPFCPRIVGRSVPWIRLSSSAQAPMNAPWFRVLLSKGARQENPTRHKSGTLDCKQRQSRLFSTCWEVPQTTIWRKQHLMPLFRSKALEFKTSNLVT